MLKTEQEHKVIPVVPVIVDIVGMQVKTLVGFDVQIFRG